MEQRQLKSIDFIVEDKNGIRYCGLKACEDKDFYNRNEIKKAMGRVLDENLFFVRTVLSKGERKISDACQKRNCGECYRFRDFQKRINLPITINMVPISGGNGAVYQMEKD